MIKNPFSNFIGFETLKVDSVLPDSLLPAERAALSPRARTKRVKEFTAGRAAARSALKQIGFDSSFPLLICQSRMALWPEGFVGSISHAAGIAIAGAAAKENVHALGLDIEFLDRDFDLRVAERIGSQTEIQSFANSSLSEVEKVLSLFSAKESIYKAYYPLIGEYFGYDAVTLRYDEDSNSFSMESHFAPLTKVSSPEVRIHCQFTDTYVFTYLVEEQQEGHSLLHQNEISCSD